MTVTLEVLALELMAAATIILIFVMGFGGLF